MKRRIFIKRSLATACSASLLSAAPLSLLHAKQLRVGIPGPGRIGFYVDYSELDSVGTHTFFVCRTHGTDGSVSVSYSTSGDSHSGASGTLTWNDGEADVKSFTVTVSNKSDGEHRIVAQLSNPTGGAILHHGQYSRAYGVIDDGSIAPDSDAVFFDENAASNGNGTRSNPYNNYYDARDNVGSKRYIYGRGVTVPDGTDVADVGGSDETCLAVPATRDNESNRLIIRNWPGYSWTVDGGSSNRKCGFVSLGANAYMTIRGIDFSNLDTSGGTYSHGGAVLIESKNGGPAAMTVELCTADNINGGSNVGAFSFINSTGCKIWRCSANNVQVNGNNQNGNAAGIFSEYDAAGYDNMYDVSIQRCKVSNVYNGAYHKKAANGTTTNVSASHRFNIYSDKIVRGIHYGGVSGYSHSKTIVQGNLFKNILGIGAGSIWHNGGYPSGAGDKHWWVGNVEDNVGSYGNAGIIFKSISEVVIFNNVQVNGAAVWHNTGSNSAAGHVEFTGYNHGMNYETSNIYKYQNVGYSSASSLNSLNSRLAMNDVKSDPKFVDSTNNDYRLSNDSPCSGTGVGGSDKGIFLTGYEVLGPQGGQPDINAPAIAPINFRAITS